MIKTIKPNKFNHSKNENGLFVNNWTDILIIQNAITVQIPLKCFFQNRITSIKIKQITKQFKINNRKCVLIYQMIKAQFVENISPNIYNFTKCKVSNISKCLSNNMESIKERNSQFSS
jgi:hypothetical protein